MKIHLSAICGTAMASLAGLLREQGHEVTGSDQDVYPPMSTQLEGLGIPIRSPFAEANVPEDADLVVIGNALSRGNPEVEAVLDRRQRFTSLPGLLAEEFLRPRTSLVVAGTHGKTTTTSLLAFLLHEAGKDPSFLIGGVPVDFGRSYRLGGGPHFVIEGDEYDCAFFDKRPKFVHYLPNVAIIGNVEFDHADIYPDLAAVQLAFVRLMNVVPRNGLLIAGTESPALVEILPKARCRVETFGLHEGADWREQGRIERKHILEDPVHPEPDPDRLGQRLNMDVAGPLLQRQENEPVGEGDDRLVAAQFAELLHADHLHGAAPELGRLAGRQLLQSHIGLVADLQGGGDLVRERKDRADKHVQMPLNLIDNRAIQRGRHAERDDASELVEGEDPVFLCERLRQFLAEIELDERLAGIHVGDVQGIPPELAQFIPLVREPLGQVEQ
jgi:hypothetical protein